MSEGKEPLDVLLGVIERREKIDWLVNQFEILVEYGSKPAMLTPDPDRNIAEILLSDLERTKSETSLGFQVETEPACEPEEYGYKPGYYQEWDVTFRYEGAELATCSIDSDGDYRAEKWVGEPAKWPTLLQGLVLLPELVIEEPSEY